MKVVEYKEPGTFANESLDFLKKSEIENTLILSVLKNLHQYDSGKPFMAGLQDGKGRTALAALMTPPHRLVISRAPQKALSVLADYLTGHNIAFPGFVGLEAVTAHFAALLSGKHVRCEKNRGCNLYSVRHVIATPPISGRLRIAEAQDMPLVIDWISAFSDDIGVSEIEKEQNIQRAEERIQSGSYFFWEHGGKPVSMAGFLSATENSARINAVYTPPEHRNRGYASACCGSLTQHLLENDCDYCVLFADQENALTNALYQKLGYKKACTYQEYEVIS